MAVWNKVKVFYQTMLGSTGSTLVATTTESTGDYDVDYIFNWLETKGWKSADISVPMFITYDAGVGNTESADYFIMHGHNFNTVGANVKLQYSSDNFSGDINDAFAFEIPSSDGVFYKSFSTQTARYWRVRIGDTPSDPPFINLCVWGDETELDYATSSFDPYQQIAQTNTSITQGGFVSGIHTKHIERNLNLSFGDADSTVYNKVKSLWENHGQKQFFVGWETANNPTDIWLVRLDATFNNPFTETSTFRNITLNMKGRKA